MPADADDAAIAGVVLSWLMRWFLLNHDEVYDDYKIN